MSYPESFMEWVVGMPPPRYQRRQQAKPESTSTPILPETQVVEGTKTPLTGDESRPPTRKLVQNPRRRVRSPCRRMVVHIETSDSEIELSETSSEDETASETDKTDTSPVKKVRFKDDRNRKDVKKAPKSAMKKDETKRQFAKETKVETPEVPEQQKSSEIVCKCCDSCSDSRNEDKMPKCKNRKVDEGKNAKQQRNKENEVGCGGDSPSQQQQGQQRDNETKQPQTQNNCQVQNQAEIDTSSLSQPPILGDKEAQLRAVNSRRSMMSRMIQPSRADVVVREDVIECPSDPRPNAFFDARTGILRVYHGPMYGNPFATLVPLRNQPIPIGSFPLSPHHLHQVGPPPQTPGGWNSGPPPPTPGPVQSILGAWNSGNNSQNQNQSGGNMNGSVQGRSNNAAGSSIGQPNTNSNSLNGRNHSSSGENNNQSRNLNNNTQSNHDLGNNGNGNSNGSNTNSNGWGGNNVGGNNNNGGWDRNNNDSGWGNTGSGNDNNSSEAWGGNNDDRRNDNDNSGGGWDSSNNNNPNSGSNNNNSGDSGGWGDPVQPTSWGNANAASSTQNHSNGNSGGGGWDNQNQNNDWATGTNLTAGSWGDGGIGPAGGAAGSTSGW
ncbi:hypothetical protein BP5796_10125 [Coleophoma crateriformis]|uniref:Uncharacterized protein n=1 Tax=Coleophoma crateriformis TaxID=565419 RepID=A0A3D8QUB0_9HELO|nr:hypothetical protein BP5796_10125 [Coleophoma crateriformis]